MSDLSPDRVERMLGLRAAPRRARLIAHATNRCVLLAGFGKPVRASEDLGSANRS